MKFRTKNFRHRSGSGGIGLGIIRSKFGKQYISITGEHCKNFSNSGKKSKAKSWVDSTDVNLQYKKLGL